MDVFVQNGKAQYLYPDGAPEMHPDVVIVRDYSGDVECGWDWNGTSFSEPILSEDFIASDARRKRNSLLQYDVDPVASNPLIWAGLAAAKQAEWAQYRTDLLNVPDQAGFPTDITWPTKPE